MKLLKEKLKAISHIILDREYIEYGSKIISEEPNDIELL